MNFYQRTISHCQEILTTFNEFIKARPDQGYHMIYGGHIDAMVGVSLPAGWIFCEQIGADQSLGIKFGVVSKTGIGNLKKLQQWDLATGKKADSSLSSLLPVTLCLLDHLWVMCSRRVSQLCCRCNMLC